MNTTQFLYETGWYPEEHDGTHPFRWMKRQATLSLQNYNIKGKKYLLITAAGHSHPEERTVVLELFLNGHKKGERTIDHVFSSYAFLFEETGDLQFEFRLSAAHQVPGDSRELGIMFRQMEVLSPPEANPFIEGWYVFEYDDFFPFRWMKQTAKINLASLGAKHHKYISFYIFSEFSDFSQKLKTAVDGKLLSEIPLLPKWNFYSYALLLPQPGEDGEKFKEKEGEWTELNLSLSKVYPKDYHPEDRRELGIRVSPPEFHDDEEAHRNFISFHQNAILNYREMLEGKTKLDSFPPNLGVDLYGKCNIKPPCVYCLWDRMKELEGEHLDTPVDEKTLKEYGPFFRSARLIINCSFGEPLLHPRFGKILDFCQKQHKILEISTNGQSFTERTIKALVGKPIYLYVSLDAACQETYQKIRNDRWETIVPSLMRLNQARKKNNNLPKIYMVFMPMKVNKGDLEAYFRLCQKVEAEALVLRPLNYLENPQIEIDRAGYHFNYEKELLPLDELKDIIRKCDEFSVKYRIPIANQFAFGEQEVPDSKSPLTPEKQRF